MSTTYQVQHDFTQQHILQRSQCTGIILRAEVLECFVEVRIRRLVVLVLGMENSALQIQRSLQVRGAVNGVGGRSSRCQSSF